MVALILACLILPGALALNSIASYSNLWIDPDYIIARNFPIRTGAAQNTIQQWATILAAQGPWCASLVLSCVDTGATNFLIAVVDKPVLPPSGDPHDYMSWAP